MTDTEPTTRSRGSDSADTGVSIDPRLTEGRSRLLLFAGLGGLALGTTVEAALVVWGSAIVIAAACVLNTAGKLIHYWGLPLPRSDRLALGASWLVLALTLVGVVVKYASARYGSGEGSFFWALAAGAVGFGLLHMAAQSNYLPDTDDGTARRPRDQT